MKLKNIYQVISNPPGTYLCQEQAVCYVLSVLLKEEFYDGTELIQRLEREYPPYRLSDTVIYKALKFLESEKAITGYWKKVEGRRRMYQVQPEWQGEAQKLAQFWIANAKKSGACCSQ